MSIPVTLHAAFSSSLKVLPPSVAAVVIEHQKAFKQFGRELTSCDNMSHDTFMETPATEQSSNSTGTKRKRVN